MPWISCNSRNIDIMTLRSPYLVMDNSTSFSKTTFQIIRMRFILIFLLVTSFYDHNAQEFILAQQAGGSSEMDNFNETAHSIALDNLGNVFITGDILGDSGWNAVFGKGQTNETTLFINGLFIAKYDPQGNLLWVKGGVQSNSIIGYGVATDNSGNCFVTGRFSNEAVFGAGELSETTLIGSFGEIFLAKYDPDGNLLWAKAAGGENTDAGYSIVTDASSNVYITGGIEGEAIFGKGEPSEKTVSTSGSKIFAAKFTNDGNFVWVHVLENGLGNGLSIALDKKLNVVLCGGDGNSFTLTKLTNTGSLVWNILPFTGSSGSLSGVAVDLEDNIYLTGDFFGNAVFGNGILSSPGDYGAFIAKYDATGKNLWARSAMGPGFDRGLSLVTDFQNSVYVTGYFNDELNFASKNAIKLIGEGKFDVFVAKYTFYGDLIWATNAGGSGNDEGKSIAVDEEGNSYIAGYFNGNNFILGKGDPTQQILSSSGYKDVFYAKFKASTDIIMGADDEVMYVDWEIFPNPTTNEIVLKVSHHQTSMIKIRIVDFSGKVIYRSEQLPQFKEHTTVINLQQQPAGIYMIQLQNDFSSHYKKFMKIN